MSNGTPRAALRAALAARDAAADRVRAAQDADARMRDMLAEAEVKLAEARDAEAGVQANHANRIKQWAAGNGARPSLEVPPDLADAARQRAEAEAHTAAFRSAAEGMAGELSEAERAVADAGAAIRPAVIAVMVADVEVELDRLAEAERAVEGLRNSVASFGAILTLRDPPPPQRLLNALSRGRIAPRFGSNPTDKAAWEGHATKLARDPDATKGAVVVREEEEAEPAVA